MIGFYNKIFNISLDAIREYYLLNNIEDWDNKRKKFNFEINDFVFNYSSRKLKSRKINDQFFIDYFNYFICQHVNSRTKIYKKNISRFKFIFISFTDIYITSIRLLIASIKNRITNYDISKISKIESCTLCIGFPDHSFNYSQDYHINPNSFVEYSLFNNIYSQNEKIISLDEYTRPSKLKSIKNKIKSLKPLNFKRFKIKKKTNIFKLLTLFPFIVHSLFDFFRLYKSFSISAFSYFLRNKTISEKYLTVYNRLIKKGIKVNNIILLHTHYIYGSVFSLFDRSKIKTFNYSQNYLIPTSNLYNEWTSQNNNFNKIPTKKLLDELYLRLFSEYYINPINFSLHGKFFSSMRQKINKKYGTRFIDSNSIEETQNKHYHSNIFSNLGYENIEIIDLGEDRSILFCDNSIESKEKNISRDFFGDIIALEDFMYNFYKEIIYAAKTLNIKVYYKGKYWQNSEKQNIIWRVSKLYNYKINYVDPYSKLMTLNQKKFDCIINYPFTSTYYTFQNLGLRNLFFIPSSYSKIFDSTIKDICLGKDQLIKNLK